MKNYLVIGGSSGIGLELVKLLATNASNHVVATYNTTDVNINLPNVEWHHYNVEDPTEIITDKLLSGLAYMPGTINLKPFKRLKVEDFKKEMQINFYGFIEALQNHLPQLLETGDASIIAFSTVALFKGMSFHSLVNSNKGALEGLFTSLAAEYAPKLRFNLIAPSLTNTPLASNMLNNDKKIEHHVNNHPLKQIGDPTNVAEMANYLLSEKSKFMTGQTIKLDGGFSL